MREDGWLEIDCYEIAGREWESRYIERKDVSEIVANIKAIKKRRIMGGKKTPAGNGRIKEGSEGHEWTEIAKGQSEIKSHTSFLVFAIKHEVQVVP